MFVLLPLLTFAGLFLLFLRGEKERDWREAYLRAALFCGAGAVLSVEALGILKGLSPLSIRIFWSLALFLTLFFLLRKFYVPLVPKDVLGSWAWYEWAGFFFIVIMLLLTLLTAVMAPPNNWDSMTYHLPRVMQWASAGSVQHYATHIPRQIFNNPGAEFLVLHIYLLSGGERWFNLVQWFSFLGCVVAGSWVAHLLGAGRWGQIFAGVFIASTPMAVLQASSTQNDLALSFWVLSCAGWGLSAIMASRPDNFLLSAVALGLSVLTKSSAFVLLPFLLWFAGSGVIRHWKFILLGAAAFLLIAGPHYARNMMLQDGKSFLHEEGAALMMQKHDVLSVASNGLRQMASEMRSLWGPANDMLVNGIRGWHAFSGVKVDDRAVFVDSLGVINKAPLVMDEDFAGNSVQVVMIIFMLGVIAALRPARPVWLYLVSVCCGVVLLWVLLKWQPWSNRLHLPSMMLFAPLFGVMADRWRWPLLAFFAVLSVFAFWAAIFNYTRPLVGQFNVFGPKDPVAFAKNRYLIPYYGITKVLLEKASCQDVGLLEKEDSWEYPLWSLTRGSGIRFRPVEVKNVSAKLESSVAPCALVTIDQDADPKLRVVKGAPFVRAWGADKIMAFYIRLRPEMLE